ncbi:MAG: hypothetical protein UZ22_OP11002000838 [Microgenomates bacterium OLB23]|nr:MAG: hypothetical protein UZ22_OP11002000838 [Microgenomates bacterium OLB23]
MPKVKKELPKAHIVFAGKHIIDYEPYFAKHKNLIEENEENITFLGLLDSGDLAHFYKNIDVLLYHHAPIAFQLLKSRHHTMVFQW